jgi:hypothetical protein
MQEYFDSTVNKVLSSIKTTRDIDITIADHDKVKGHKNAIGICYRDNDNNYKITIDEFFVSECYDYFIKENKYSTWFLVGETLESVICHEIAHMLYWRHGKKHREKQTELLNMVDVA